MVLVVQRSRANVLDEERRTRPSLVADDLNAEVNARIRLNRRFTISGLYEHFPGVFRFLPTELLPSIARSEPGGTRWRTGGEVKGKLANGVGSNYSHATSERGVSSITQADAHTSATSNRLNWRPRRFKWTRPFRGKTKSGFCACAITFRTSYTSITGNFMPHVGCQTCWRTITKRKAWELHWPFWRLWIFRPHVTDDKTWIAWITPGSKQQSLHWQHTGSPDPKVSSRCWRRRKSWVEFSGTSKASFADSCWVILWNAKEATAGSSQPTTRHTDKWSLLHDSSLWHAAAHSGSLLEQLKWEIFEHPPYSPYLAPSD